MGFQREFDPELAEESLRACVNDGALQGAESYALSVNATTSSSVELPAGIYRVFLAGMSAAEQLALRTGESGVTASLPGGSASASAVFSGNEVVRVRVQPDGRYLAAISAAGSGTLYIVPVVKL